MIFLQNLQSSYIGRKPKQNTEFSFTRTKIKVIKIKKIVKIVKKIDDHIRAENDQN